MMQLPSKVSRAASRSSSFCSIERNQSREQDCRREREKDREGRGE